MTTIATTKHLPIVKLKDVCPEYAAALIAEAAATRTGDRAVMAAAHEFTSQIAKAFWGGVAYGQAEMERGGTRFEGLGKE